MKIGHYYFRRSKRDAQCIEREEPPIIPVEVYLREWNPKQFSELLGGRRVFFPERVEDEVKFGQERRQGRPARLSVLNRMTDRMPEIQAGIDRILQASR